MKKQGWAWISKQWIASVTIIALSVALTACGSTNNAMKTAASKQVTAKQSVSQTVSSASTVTTASSTKSTDNQTKYPLTIKDASGLEMTFSQEPKRIISLAPSETEILFALGLGDKVVGVSPYETYPKEALSKPKIGDMSGSGEAIIQAQPDVVFTGLSLSGKSVEQLRQLHITVFTVEPKTIDQIMDTILQIGKITNTQERAQQVVAKMKEQKQTVVDALKGLKDSEKKKVYLEFSPGWTVGSGEFMSNMVALAGGMNIADVKKGWYAISEEKIVQDNPDVILYADGIKDYKTGKPLKEIIMNRSGWSKIKALQNKRVIGLDKDIISRPGPRATEALLDIAKAIYPDRVK